jgi:hypothetical protein
VVTNRKIVSKWANAPLPSEEQLQDDAGRQINAEQLYAAADVLDAIKAGGGADAIFLYTKKCQRDVANMVWDNDDVLQLLQDALAAGKRVSPEWCVQNPTGPAAACDVYILRRRERHPNKPIEILMEYYVKFAIGHTGKVILVFSCHTTDK